MSFLIFLKSQRKKLEVSFFNNIKWIGFYHLIKLRFCVGQSAGYFNKANQRFIIFYSVFENIASGIDERIMLSYLL